MKTPRRRVTVDVVVRMEIDVADDLGVHEVIKGIGHCFTDNIGAAEVVDAEIIRHEVIEGRAWGVYS